MSGTIAEFHFQAPEKPGLLRRGGSILRKWFRKEDPFPELKVSYPVSFSSGGEPFRRESTWNNNAIEQLEKYLAQMLDSAISRDDVSRIADQLHSFLFANREFDAIFDRALRIPNEPTFQREIQISADKESFALLANLPWEIARDTMPPEEIHEESLLGTLAPYPIVRAIRLQSAPAVTPAKVRVQCCIANYEGDVKQFDAKAFHKIVRECVNTQMVDLSYVRAAEDRPTFEQTEHEIDDVEPHIFIFIGHGTTQEGKPQLCFEKWIDVQDLAQDLAKSKQTLLAILIACDQSRIIRAPAAQSGALTLIQGGIPAVVAMQGYVDPNRAKAFLHAFLNNLFITHSIAKAAAKGRIAMEATSPGERWTSDWILPAVFRGISQEAEETQLAVVLGHYQPALERLLTFVPPVTIHLARPALESELLKYLNEANGLLQITGGIGAGKTQLMRIITRQRIQDAVGTRSPLPRPIFYIDLDEYDDSSTLERWLLSKLQSRFADVRALLASSTLTTIMSKEWAAAELAGALRTELDRSRIILIVDHLRDDNTEFWNKLLIQAVDLQNSLLIVVGPPPEIVPSALKTLEVPAFDLEETKAYVKRFVIDDVDLAVEWHESSEGNPLLLDGLRAFNKSGVLKAPTDILLRKEEKVAARYIQLIKETTDPEEFAILCAFYWFPGLVETELGQRFIPGNDTFEALNNLVEKGALTKIEKSGKQWLSLARLKADGLNEEDTQNAALAVTGHFYYELLAKDDAQKELDDLAVQPGGTTLLRGIQSAYMAIGDLQSALNLAFLLTEALKNDAFQRYLFFVSVLDPKPDIKVPDSAWVEAAGAARRVGKLDQADSFLAELKGKELTKYLNARLLNTMAMIMKDRGQSDYTEVILNYCEQGIAVAEAGVSGKIANEEITTDEWRDLLSNLLYNRSAILPFFASRQSEALDDIRRVQELETQRDKVFAAAAMCQEVDILLRQPRLIEDWSHLLNLLRDAYVILTKPQSADNLPYCCYQYARFYRKRPAKSDDERLQYLRTAARYYDEAAKTASVFGDFKRRAAAIEHWVRVSWEDLRGLPDVLSDQDAAAKLDEFLPALQEYGGDAYAARILRDTLFLRAEIESAAKGARSRELLKAACIASVATPLHPSRIGEDRVRGIRIFISYLGSLRAVNDLHEAESFLVDHRYLVDNWVEDARTDQPWETLTKLIAKEKLWAT